MRRFELWRDGKMVECGVVFPDGHALVDGWGHLEAGRLGKGEIFGGEIRYLDPRASEQASALPRVDTLQTYLYAFALRVAIHGVPALNCRAEAWDLEQLLTKGT